MKNLKSSNAKRRKFSYYFYYIPLVCFLPSIISRLRLSSILKNKNSHQEYVKSRVRYYSKKTSNFKVSKNAKNFILTNYSEDNFKFSFKKLFDTV